MSLWDSIMLWDIEGSLALKSIQVRNTGNKPSSIAQNRSLGHLDNHLAEVAAAVQILESILRLLEFESAIDDGVNAVLAVELNHFLKSILGSVEHALESNVAAQSEQVGVQAIAGLVFLTAEVTNARDAAAESDAVEAATQSLSATALENVVGSGVFGDTHDLVLPFRVGAVVDGEVGSHRFRPLELLVR